MKDTSIALINSSEYRLNALRLLSVDSTNDLAFRLIAKAKAKKKVLPDSFLITAKEQTKGRGRKGHEFSSLMDNGLYMSLVLMPKSSIKCSSLITPAVAVSVLEALEECGCSGLGIKWVNDLYKEGKKVAGILTESRMDERGGIEYLIIGIGININADIDNMPPDVREIAGSLNISKISMEDLSILIAEIVRKRINELAKEETKEILSIYRDRQILLGKEVSWIEKEKEHTGRAVDINDEGNIIIDEGGVMRTLFSGEVSIRSSKNE